MSHFNLSNWMIFRQYRCISRGNFAVSTRAPKNRKNSLGPSRIEVGKIVPFSWSTSCPLCSLDDGSLQYDIHFLISFLSYFFHIFLFFDICIIRYENSSRIPCFTRSTPYAWYFSDKRSCSTDLNQKKSIGALSYKSEVTSDASGRAYLFFMLCPWHLYYLS